MKFVVYIPLLVILLFGMTACTAAVQQGPQITIEQPWVRAAVAMQAAGAGQMEGSMEGSMEGGEGGMELGGATSAAYLIIRNAGQQEDHLLEVRTEAAESVETHISETRDGVSVMSRVDGIEIPAESSVELEPGGLHIMLINLNQDLNPGDSIQMTLVFEKSGALDIDVPVRAP